MSIDTQLAELLGKNADLFAAYEQLANGQIMWLAGTVDDPDSFDAQGGKVGPLGYYPVTNVSGQTVYVPCMARLKRSALDGVEEALTLLPGGILRNGVWVRLPALYKLLVGGVGSLSLDACSVGGVVTSKVFSLVINAATERLQYFYAGDDAVAIRATLTGTATAEII